MASSKRKYDGPSSEEVLVADMVSLMERDGLAPWRKPWTGSKGWHRNLLSGENYKGSNPLLLEMGSMMRGHGLPLWLGAGQAKAEGWLPRKGSKGVRILRPQVMGDKEKPEDQWVAFRPVVVFNVEALNGVDEVSQARLDSKVREALGQAETVAPQARLEAAESVLEGWKVPTSWGGVEACYSPSLDQIRMPHADTFSSREAFCATWAHEQIHSTGHKDRLARDMGSGFGTKSYAREELVAELGAVLVSYRLQIGCEMEGHAAYLRHWAELLRDGGAKVLYKVLSDARKAADLLVGEAA